MKSLVRWCLFAGILGTLGCGGPTRGWGVGGGTVSRIENGETIS
jgi:hypothetical protein